MTTTFRNIFFYNYLQLDGQREFDDQFPKSAEQPEQEQEQERQKEEEVIEDRPELR